LPSINRMRAIDRDWTGRNGAGRGSNTPFRLPHLRNSRRWMLATTLWVATMPWWRKTAFSPWRRFL